MEAVDDPPCNNTLVEGIKTNLLATDIAAESNAPQVCQKSNGVVESVSHEIINTEESISAQVVENLPKNDTVDSNLSSHVNNADEASVQPVISPKDAEIVKEDKQNPKSNKNAPEVPPASSPLCETSVPDVISDEIPESQTFTCPEAELADLEGTVEAENESNSHNVSFETEVLVEENVDLSETTEVTQNETNDMLHELDKTMEFSEVLNSSEVSSNVENNNCSVKQEVFNKEELLDILQGKNDDEVMPSHINKQIETQIALRQLSRLKRETRGKVSPKNLRNKKANRESSVNKKHKETAKKQSQKVESEKQNQVIPSNTTLSEETTEKQVESDEKDGDSIVDVLVKDWDDEPDGEVPKNDVDISKTSEKIPQNEKSEETGEPIANDSTTENQIADASKTGDDGHTRRLGRVIKKKVIFDPDNPDTFTKGKTPVKAKEHVEPPAKTRKLENMTTPRANSKSPVGKAQWKKPTPRNKNCKRLTEVDKLLMDEGAVNMMYQLTPEVSKGKKTMRTKAEIIKKLQSSTPEGNEMKFRERKKEEAKKILGSKQRSSMSSSVKSVGEDFETHSADDSIIYRRHSSSSYSSSCMSPRRMSDVETNTTQVIQPTTDVTSTPKAKKDLPKNDVFVPETPKLGINKEDCLNLKQKLNSKLSQALNKRKRESTKTDKPTKQIKVKEETAKSRMLDYIGFKYLSVKFEQRLAEVNISTTPSKNTVPILKELELALSYVDKKSEVSVTFLTSSCGTIINSALNLQPLLDNNIETRTNAAHELAEAIRLLLCAIKQHSKLLVSSVWGECVGVSLAVLGLSDVVLCSERATFSLQTPTRRAAQPLLPGMAVFTTGYCKLQQPLLNELVLFGRRFSSAEALSCGLASRVLWPDRYQEQARALVKDIAAQPATTVQLKKRLLNLKNSSESDNTFLSGLEAERDMFVEYWTSVEGQELLRTYLTPVFSQNT